MLQETRACGPFLESPEKPFLKARLAYSIKLVFSHVVRGTKTKITAKFCALRRPRFEDTRKLSPEMRPKSFGTCEKWVPGASVFLESNEKGGKSQDGRKVPRRVNSTIHWVTQLILTELIRQRVSYPEVSAIHPWGLGLVSRKFRELFEPEKPVVKLQSASFEKSIF